MALNLASDANSELQTTIPGPPRPGWRVEVTVVVSWSAPPTAPGLLSIVNSDGGTEIAHYAGQGSTSRSRMIDGKTLKLNNGATITLGAGGADVIGRLYIDYRYIPAPAKASSLITHPN